MHPPPRQPPDGLSLERCLEEALESLRLTNEELVEVLALLAATFESGPLRSHIGRRALRALAEGQRAERLLAEFRARSILPPIDAVEGLSREQPL
jgi:hypothetical protein